MATVISTPFVRLLPTALLLGVFPPAQQPVVGRTIVVIVADDLGVDQLRAYRTMAGVPSEDLPRTPTLDALAAEGVLFRHAYANPVCSPTRATLLTGRFACRQGVGEITGPNFGEPLADDEVTLPELLRAANTGFRSVAIGKWHLGYEWSHADAHKGRNHPVNDGGGFDFFSGTCDNLMRAGDSHTHYLRRTIRRDPAAPDHPLEVEPDALQQRFSATVQTDCALAAMSEAQTPLTQDLFVYLCFNVPHEPWQKPPDELHSLDERLGDAWRALPEIWDGKNDATARLYYQAMVEAMDTEIGRLRRDLPAARRPGATILFLGDNGTPQQTTAAPFVKSHAKGTLYEGGIRVPLIVAGCGVTAAPGSVVDRFVQTTDVFATVAALAGVDEAHTAALVARPLDALSLLSLLDADPDNDRAWPRWWAFAERFSPNGGEGDPMDTIDALDPPVTAPNLAGFERPQLGAATLQIVGEPFMAGNRSRVVLRGSAGRRCRLRVTASLLPLTPELVTRSAVGSMPGVHAAVLVGPGVTETHPIAGIYSLFDVEHGKNGEDDAERVVYNLNGELSRSLAGSGCTVLFQALVLDDGEPAKVVAVSNIVTREAPRNWDVKALRDERFKLILTDNGGKEQLYDLVDDPFEQRDLLRGGRAALAGEARTHYVRLRREIDRIVTGAPDSAAGER